MHTSHLKALRNKHEKLEKNLHAEMLHSLHDGALIGALKKEKLRLKEEIERLQRDE